MQFLFQQPFIVLDFTAWSTCECAARPQFLKTSNFTKIMKRLLLINLLVVIVLHNIIIIMRQDQGKSASYRLTPALHNLQLLPDPLYPLHALYLLHPPTVPTIHSLHQLYPYPQYPLYPQLHFTHYTSYTHHHSSSLYFRPRSTAIIQPA